LLAQLADVRLARGRLSEAATLLEEADDIVEGLVTRASSPWARSRIIAGMDEVLVLRIRLEGERSRGDPARLFAVLERARARSLVDLLNSRSTTGALIPSEQQAVERRISALQLQLLRTNDRGTRQRLLDEILAAEGQLAPITTELFAAADAPARARITLSQVQRVLRADELLLEFALTEPSSFAVAITRTEARLIRLPSRSATEAQIEALVNAIQEGRPATAEAKALGVTLLSAVPNLGRYTRLMVSADGISHKVPFDLLISPSGTLLLETHTVSYVPSASTLVALRSRSSKSSPTQMALAVGASPSDPSGLVARPSAIGGANRGVYDVDAERLRPLPSAADEARAVVSAFPGRPSTALVGDAATEAAVKAQPLDTFQVVHFAAHGIVSTKVPSRSAIVLLPGGGDDGLLQAGEVLDLRLSADVVTLSACDTGAGTLHGQEGVASLVRPFLAAGARTVVANLWTADDDFSLGLMREFYRQLAAGVDVGEALREAKLRMRQQFGPAAVPKLWSGVLASGDTVVTVAPPAGAERKVQ
jgi:CHAT domain-containing protein